MCPLEDEKDLPNIPKIPPNLSDEELASFIDPYLTNERLPNSPLNQKAESKAVILKIYKSDLPEEEKNRRIACMVKVARNMGPRSKEQSVSEKAHESGTKVFEAFKKKFGDEPFVKDKTITVGNTEILAEVFTNKQDQSLSAIKKYKPEHPLDPNVRANFLEMARLLENEGITDDFYAVESGVKIYGFYQYINASDKLENALTKGNYEEIVHAYDELEKMEQKYLRIIQKAEELLGKDNLCENVDIARSVRYPQSFKDHNVACSNINSVFYFVALCKKMNISFEEAIDNYSEIVPKKLPHVFQSYYKFKETVLPPSEPLMKRMAHICYCAETMYMLISTRAFDLLPRLEADPEKSAESQLYFLKCGLSEELTENNLLCVFASGYKHDGKNRDKISIQALKNMLVLGQNTEDLFSLNPELISPTTFEKNVVNYEGGLKNITLDEAYLRQIKQNIFDFVKYKDACDQGVTQVTPTLTKTDLLLAYREVVADLVRTKGYDKTNKALDRAVKNFLYYPLLSMGDYANEHGLKRLSFDPSEEHLNELKDSCLSDSFVAGSTLYNRAIELANKKPVTVADFKECIGKLDLFAKRKEANTYFFSEWNDRAALEKKILDLKNALKKTTLEGIPFPITEKLIQACLKNPADMEAKIGMFQTDLRNKNTPETIALIEEMKQHFNPLMGVTETNPDGADYSVSNFKDAMLHLMGKHVSGSSANPAQLWLKSREQVIAEARALEEKVLGIVTGGGNPLFAHSALLNSKAPNEFNIDKTNALKNSLTDDQIYTAYANQLDGVAVSAAARNVTNTIPDLKRSDNPEQSVNTFRDQMKSAKILTEIRASRTFWWKFTHLLQNSAEKTALATMRETIIGKGVTEKVYNQFINASATDAEKTLDSMCRQLQNSYQRNAVAENKEEDFELMNSLMSDSKEAEKGFQKNNQEKDKDNHLESSQKLENDGEERKKEEENLSASV